MSPPPDLADFVRSVFEQSAATKQRAGEALAENLVAAARLVAEAYRAGGTLYAFGNGGSAADAQHLAGELVGRYHRTRRPLGAVALSTDPSALTCIANDFDYDQIFARQIEAMATPRDVVFGITTSGRSRNVIRALARAQEAGARTIALTGGDGGEVVQHAQVSLIVPASYTPRIQECHITAIHALCELIELLVLEMPLPEVPAK